MGSARITGWRPLFEEPRDDEDEHDWTGPDPARMFERLLDIQQASKQLDALSSRGIKGWLSPPARTILRRDWDEAWDKLRKAVEDGPA